MFTSIQHTLDVALFIRGVENPELGVINSQGVGRHCEYPLQGVCLGRECVAGEPGPRRSELMHEGKQSTADEESPGRGIPEQEKVRTPA